MARRALVKAAPPQPETTAPVSEPALIDAIREDILSASGQTGGSPLGSVAVSRALGKEARLLGSRTVFDAAPQVRAHLHGLGPLQGFLDDPTVTDVLVNGPHDIWVDSGRGLTRVALRFASDDDVRDLAQRIMALGGRRVDDSHPCGDVRLEECRVHAVLPPLATNGTTLSIRVARERALTLSEFFGTSQRDAFVRQILEQLVAEKRNFLVSGGTGSGKTSLLNAMLSLVSPMERIILVEDAAELRPDHPHVVSLQAKHANAEGQGEFTLADLLKQAMRMRPDRLVVGECRGPEVRELLAAMNTGHVGSGGTLHANSAEGVPARLMAMGALAGLTQEALALQVLSAVDVVLHVERSGSERRLTQVGVFYAQEGLPKVRPALRMDAGSWQYHDGLEDLEQLCDF